ncbi:hypothetical protein GW17_00058389 [Ensete ventricosum]|nr:hypothetical protein GW17_00058389 [Ensete ventricosum]
MTNQDNHDLTLANPTASGILAVSLLVFFWRSPGVFIASFPFSSVNLLVNFDEIPLFSATPDNLPMSLGLLLANSLTPSWQTLDTFGELPMHSWRVPNRIDPMHGLDLGQS